MKKNIEITLEEEAVLVVLLRNVSGNPNTTTRRHTARVLSQLDEERFKVLDKKVIMKLGPDILMLKGSLEVIADAVCPPDLSKVTSDQLQDELNRRA